MKGKPTPVDEALLLSRRRMEDEQVVARYAAGAGRGHDMGPMRAFVEKVRRDLGPRAVICDVAINGQPRNVEAWVVSYFFPGEEETAPLQIPTPEVNDLPIGVVRSASAGLAVERGDGAHGDVRGLLSRGQPTVPARPEPGTSPQARDGSPVLGSVGP